MLKLIKRTLTAALVVAATAPSLAYARLDLNPSGSSVSGGPAQAGVVSSVQRPKSPSAGGFQWDDAGIGAASVVVLLSLGTGVVLVRQRRTHQSMAG